MPAHDEDFAHGMAALSVNDRPLPDLPTELTDAIIDQLHDDRKALVNCSVVCRRWMKSSRYHLFDKVIVRGEKPGSGFTSFLAFLDATPIIHGYIRSLTFRVTANPTGKASELRSIGPYTLVFILKILPALRTLVFENITWNRHLLAGPDGHAIDWPPSPRPLDSFTLSHVVTDEPRVFRLSNLVDLVWAFGPLRRLNLINLVVEFDSSTSVPQWPDYLHLEEFFVQSNYARVGDPSPLAPISEVLSKHLRKVDLACGSDDEAPLVGQLIRFVGPTLQELRLNMSDMTVLRAFNAPGPWHMFNLPSLTSLRSFELHVWSSGAHITGDLFTYDGQWCLCSVAPILSQLQPTLHHIRIDFSISGYRAHLLGHLQTMDWAGLQSQFKRFSELQSIYLEVRPRKGHNVLPESLFAVSELAERKLAPLVASGLLEVDVSTEAPMPVRSER